jgi:restriction system protein
VTIPDYQALMLPLLRILSDGASWHISDYTAALARAFDLSDEEQRQLLPSGNQTVIKNRAGWARTYLLKAGLVESVARGSVRISDQGRQVLARNPPRIDNAFLGQFDSFND